MRNRNVARIIAIILALIMVFSVVWVILDSITASASVSQADIDRLKGEKKEYERRKREIQSRINTIEFEKMTEVAKKRVLDDQIMLTGMEIENIAETIEYFEMLIVERSNSYVFVTRDNCYIAVGKPA